MPVAFVFVALFASVFGVFYLFITTRNRERMAMIEKGVDLAFFWGANAPKAIKGRSNGSFVKFSLKSGMLLIGMGVGFVISVLFSEVIRSEDLFALLACGIVFICGGMGMVAGFYMGRNLDKKDEMDAKV